MLNLIRRNKLVTVSLLFILLIILSARLTKLEQENEFSRAYYNLVEKEPLTATVLGKLVSQDIVVNPNTVDVISAYNYRGLILTTQITFNPIDKSVISAFVKNVHY